MPAAALAVLGASASAQERPDPRSPVRFSGTQTFIAEYVGDNGGANESIYGDDDNYASVRNIFYLQASNRHFSSGLRLDALLFHNPPYAVDADAFVPGGDGYTTLNYGNDFRLERIYGTATLGKLKVIVGDFYASFGRGMALSLTKLDDVGVDNTLRGLRLEYRIPRKFKAVAVGGVVNALNVDPLTHQLLADDPLDRVAGLRLEWELLDALVLGLHGVLMAPRFEDEAAIAPERLFVDQSPGIAVRTAGASAELHIGGVHVYLEGNGQTHDNHRPIGPAADVEGESGGAVFGEVSYDLSPFTIKAEGIFYRRWLMEGPLRGTAPNISLTQPLTYHRMVTLEPVWMPIKSFGNAYGGRLTGNLFLEKSNTQIALKSAFLEYEGGLLPQGQWDDHPPTFAVHPVFELRQRFAESEVSLNLEGGFRHETTSDPQIEGENTGHLWHVEADLGVPIEGPHSVEISGALRRHELLITEGLSYWVALASAGYDWSGKFGLTIVYEYSDQSAGARVLIGDWEYFMPRRHYLWAVASVHFPKPLDRLVVRLLGGSQRGGIKCAGGICRTYPDAVGGKLEAVLRF